jgi:hypothetical protein
MERDEFHVTTQSRARERATRKKSDEKKRREKKERSRMVLCELAPRQREREAQKLL